MLPNVPQYPVAVAAILRAGFVVVNVNPLYTPRELEHQLKDSGAKAIVILENFAATLAAGAGRGADQDRAAGGDGRHARAAQGRRGQPRGAQRARSWCRPTACPARCASTTRCKAGRTLPLAAPGVGPDDIAVLQYTGGTTGVSKGAVLLHRNLVANILQSEAWYQPALDKIPAGEQLVTVCALPLYHIFGFTANMMLGAAHGRLQHPDPERARHRRRC